jgi:hypothetical protein
LPNGTQRLFARRTLEDGWYDYQQGGFAALMPKTRAVRRVLLPAGANGVGKSALVGRWVSALDRRRFYPLALTHASLSGSGLLAALTAKLGKPPTFTRPTNLALIEAALAELGPVLPVIIQHTHARYCQLTGQTLRLGFERERLWFELLRAGYAQDDLRRVVTYLQREIRAQRRNVGALKLSNLLQPDRFQEDLQISRLRLPPQTPSPRPPPPPTRRPLADQQHGRQRALECLRQLKNASR